MPLATSWNPKKKNAYDAGEAYFLPKPLTQGRSAVFLSVRVCVGALLSTNISVRLPSVQAIRAAHDALRGMPLLHRLIAWLFLMPVS